MRRGGGAGASRKSPPAMFATGANILTVAASAAAAAAAAVAGAGAAAVAGAGAVRCLPVQAPRGAGTGGGAPHHATPLRAAPGNASGSAPSYRPATGALDRLNYLANRA